MPSGLLLVTGPKRLNGVPLRRVNQMYVIITMTMVDIRRVVIPKHLNADKFYKRRRGRIRGQKNNGDIFRDAALKSYQVPEQRHEDQRAVDDQLLPAIGKVPNLRGYLRSMFSLKKTTIPTRTSFLRLQCTVVNKYRCICDCAFALTSSYFMLC